MATQRLTVATFGGDSAAIVARLYNSWRTNYDPAAVDRFCEALREKGPSLPILYFCEWADRWLMGDLVPGPNAVHGRRHETTCFTPDQARTWASQCGHQFPEQEWLASRLREAAAVWDAIECRLIVSVREVLAASATDEEIEACLFVPAWLSDPGVTPQ